MSVQEFQRALADMTLDVDLALAVRSRGAEALAGYALTGRERRRLEDVARQPGMSVSCSLARANRFGPIHDVFPMTCVLLGHRLRDLLDELWRQRRPDNYQLTGEETSFADYVEARLAAGSLPVEYLREVFDYERACWDVAMAFRAGDGASGDRARSVRFSHDPAVLLDTLGRHEIPPPNLATREYLVRVRVSGDQLQAAWDEPSG